MQTFNRICLKNYSVSDEGGNTASVEFGKKYITSAIMENGNVTVFSRYWFQVPIDVFGGEMEFTEA